VIADGDAGAIRDNRQVQQVYLGTGRTFTPHAALQPGTPP
jgi:branched-chain amino acid transport system ATP-binding protein